MHQLQSLFTHLFLLTNLINDIQFTLESLIRTIYLLNDQVNTPKYLT